MTVQYYFATITSKPNYYLNWRPPKPLFTEVRIWRQHVSISNAGSHSSCSDVLSTHAHNRTLDTIVIQGTPCLQKLANPYIKWHCTRSIMPDSLVFSNPILCAHPCSENSLNPCCTPLHLSKVCNTSHKYENIDNGIFQRLWPLEVCCISVRYLIKGFQSSYINWWDLPLHLHLHC